MNTQPEFATCLLSLGFDFGLLQSQEREARFPGLHDDFGYVEAFVLLTYVLEGLYEALLLEYPDWTDASGESFWDLYHGPAFTPGGCFSYDVASAILDELLANPVTNGDTSDWRQAGRRAFQRLKTASPDLAHNIQTILTTV